MEAIYRWHPMFAQDDRAKVWHGSVERNWGRPTVEGGDVMPSGNDRRLRFSGAGDRVGTAGLRR